MEDNIMKTSDESLKRIEEVNKALSQLEYLRKIYRSDESHYITRAILPLEELLQEEVFFAYKAGLLSANTEY